jgi:hypothetical protein
MPAGSTYPHLSYTNDRVYNNFDITHFSQMEEFVPNDNVVTFPLDKMKQMNDKLHLEDKRNEIRRT